MNAKNSTTTSQHGGTDQVSATLIELSDALGAMNPPVIGEAVVSRHLTASLIAASSGSDITMSPADVRGVGEVREMLGSGHLTLIVEQAKDVGLAGSTDPSSTPPAADSATDTDASDASWITIVIEALSKREFEWVRIDRHGERYRETVSARKLRSKLRQGDVLIARHAIQCQEMSSCDLHDPDHANHVHMPPTTRLVGLLKMDARDIWLVALFALIAGVLALATPLAVESLVNVVSWGVYLQPLLWLGLILLVSLGLGGIFRILQTVIVEIIQRRQFVRIVGDLSHRYPMADTQSLEAEDRNELSNRFFDIMTIQKATTVLLLDGISIILSAAIGMVLLAFYHPFLLGFDLVLLLAMIGVTWLLGRGGVRTAIQESIAKYEVAHWLEDILSTPEAFKTGGGSSLAIRQSNRLVADYLDARRRQFRVVLRQVTFAILLQVVASTALLALGGYLVISGQLTLGQLVASELVVTVVVGAFSKAGKSIEKYYDLVAAIDKVGHLLDIQTVPQAEIGSGLLSEAVGAKWSDLKFETQTAEHDITYQGRVASGEAEPGTILAIVGDDSDTRGMLSKSLAGMISPHAGTVTIGDVDAETAAVATVGRRVGYVGRSAIFHGSLSDNVDLGRAGLTSTEIRAALRDAGLADVVSRLSGGLRTPLQTGGYPLSPSQQLRLMFARAIIAKPSVLVIDGALDSLSDRDGETLWDVITEKDRGWTVVINTSRDDIAQRCDQRFFVGPRSAGKSVTS